MRTVKTYPVASFFALAIALSWAVWVPGFLGYFGPPTQLLMLVGSLAPAVAAALLTKAQGRSLRAWLVGSLRFRIGARWWLVALGLPVAVAAANAVVYALGFGALDVSQLSQRVVFWVFGLVVFTLIAGGFGEFGWRGYALPHLQRTRGALSASLIVGVAWAVWFAPAFVLPGGYFAGRPFALYAPLIVALSVVLAWLYNSTGGSVPAAMALYAGVYSAPALIPAATMVQYWSFEALAWYERVRLLCFVLVAVALAAHYGSWTLSAREKHTTASSSDSRDPVRDAATSD